MRSPLALAFARRYTRETRWTPPHGAPRVELEWWEQPYKQRRDMEKKKFEQEVEDDDEPEVAAVKEVKL